MQLAPLSDLREARQDRQNYLDPTISRGIQIPLALVDAAVKSPANPLAFGIVAAVKRMR